MYVHVHVHAPTFATTFLTCFAHKGFNALTCAAGLGHIDVVFDVALDVFGLELTVV